MTKEELENSIGLQLNFFQFSGASAEDTIRRILSRAEQYANQKALEIAAEAWDMAESRKGMAPTKSQYLSNLKKKIEP